MNYHIQSKNIATDMTDEPFRMKVYIHTINTINTTNTDMTDEPFRMNVYSQMTTMLILAPEIFLS